MAKQKNWNPETKKQMILASAIEVLNRRQYHDCPVDEIARNAGIAKGTVYLYFNSKEELYCAVFLSLLSSLRDTTEEVHRLDMPATKKLHLLFEKLAVFMSEHSQIFNSITHDTPLKGRLLDDVHHKRDELIKTISRIVEQGIDSKEFKQFPPVLAGRVFLSMATVIARMKIEAEQHRTRVSPETVFNIFLNGIGR